MEVKVLACKKNEFEDRFKPGQKVVGYNVSVALPGNNGWIDVWCSHECNVGDVVTLEITEGKYHKAKVRVV